MKKEIYETIIIGAGMAGLSAAIYASRKKMKYEIISSDFGGQFNVSGEVLNYPGIVKTTGGALSTLMRKQIEFNKVKVLLETVKKVRKKGKGFLVVTDKNKYETKTVIIATGSRPRKLMVTGEERFLNRGLTYCAVCDGPLFSGKEVAVIGGGDSAMEAVDFMKEIASKIYLIVKEEKLEGHEYLEEKVKKNKKVRIFLGAETLEILGGKFVSGIRFKQRRGREGKGKEGRGKESKGKEGKIKELKVGGVIVEIGREPNTGLFKGLVELDKHGHIKIDEQGKTSRPGVYGAGDCASGHEYQYVIAAGQGCMALLKAARELARGEDNQILVSI